MIHIIIYYCAEAAHNHSTEVH